jgi:hypothetical protein
MDDVAENNKLLLEHIQNIRDMLIIVTGILILQLLAFAWVILHLTRLVIAP